MITQGSSNAELERRRFELRWSRLRYHPTQWAFWRSTARFIVVPSGRRSGKTELAKRKVIARACDWRNLRLDRKYAFAAPTRDQAKRIYWADLKKMVPPAWQAGLPSETDLEIRLVTGTRLCVVGMDKPERLEGEPLDGIVLDEYANMKASAWTENVSPALDTPGRLPGWAYFIGVPEGRTHYYDLWCDVPRLQAAGESWDRFHWKSAEIMSPAAIEALRSRMDERTFRQELEGSFESYGGLAYYNWSDANVVKDCARLYQPEEPLIVCFDFNTKPGVCAIMQELRVPGVSGRERITVVLGEVWIAQHSNTPRVVNRFLADWRHHRGTVHVYGDATGGARTTTSVAGSDWDLIEADLTRVYQDRLAMLVPSSNPSERSRVNAVNCRTAATDGKLRLVVDPVEAPHVVRDFERVETLEGGTGEIKKAKRGRDGKSESESDLTHISDAIGYYIVDRWPLVDNDVIDVHVA